MNSSSLSNQTTTVSYFIFESVFNYFGGLEIVFGIFGNVLSIVVVCSRKKLRSLATFVFTSAMSVTSTVVLLTITLMKFVNEIFQLNLDLKTPWWCKICTFFTFFPYQWLSWLIVCNTLELFLSARWYNFRHRHSNPRRSLYVSIGLGILAFALNSPAWSIESFQSSEMDSTTWLDANFFTLICLRPFRIDQYAGYFMILNQSVSACVATFSVAILNYLLVKELYAIKNRVSDDTKTKNQQLENRRRARNILSATAKVLLSTVGFAVLILPRPIVIFLYIYKPKPQHLVVYKSFDFLSQYLMCFNVVGLFIKNKQFSDEFDLMMGSRRKKKSNTIK